VTLSTAAGDHLVPRVPGEISEGESLPLARVRVLELASIGPGPHAALLLADHGADIVRVERPTSAAEEGRPDDLLLRGRRRVFADLKDAADHAAVMTLVERADVLIEGFRPGVVERLGLGPVDCHAANPRLVYGRITGWGQEGPLSSSAGHDINYLGLTGALHAMGNADDPPPPPLNLVGDFGGGSTYLVIGILMALLERERTGRGRVVDASVVDGTMHLQQLIWARRAQGRWTDRRHANLLDGGAPFYRTYRCADGRFVAVGALEPQFYAELVRVLGLDETDLPAQQDREGWPVVHAAFEAAFATQTRAQWQERFEAVDACVSPVLAYDEVAEHPHNLARANLVVEGQAVVAAPAPRLGSGPAPIPPMQAPAGWIGELAPSLWC